MFIQRYHKARTLYRQKTTTKKSSKIAIPITIPNQSNHNSYSYIVRRKKEQYSEKDIRKTTPNQTTHPQNQPTKDPRKSRRDQNQERRSYPRPPNPAPSSPSSAIATRQAGDDHVEERDHAVDDGHADGADGVHDAH